MKSNHPTVNFFIIWISLLVTTQISAQTDYLPRKGALGVRLEQLTDTHRTTAGYREAAGAFISEVLPNSTGQALGLASGDIILQLDGDAVSDVQAVVQQTQSWREGQSLQIKVWRAGRSIDLNGKIKGKPLESSEMAEVIYDEVPFRDGRLRSIIHKPKADGKLPLVVYLQGFSCSSIDYYYMPGSPVRQLVDGLVERGFAVFRVEKPGVGDSDGSLNCEDIGYDTEVAAFDAAMDQLSKYDFVDQEKIFYFGHSLGGVTAPLLAAKHQPKGVAVYGTVFASWYEYMQRVFRDQAYVRGDDWIRTENASREAQEFLARLFITRESPQEMRKDPELKQLLDNGILEFDGDSRFVGRHYTFWQELNAANPVQAWRDAGVHSLAMYGQFDLHAIDSGDTEKIADLVNHYHPGKGKFVLLPGTEHGFTKVPSMQEYVQMRSNGTFSNSYMAEHFNPEVVKITADWMEEVLQTDDKKVGKN
jgi:hypothetical protein